MQQPPSSSVGTVGVIVHRPLSRVPENWLKFGVGVMLTSFGTFWSAEGAGVDWPGGEICLVAVVAYIALLSAVLTRVLTIRSHAGGRPGQLAPG